METGRSRRLYGQTVTAVMAAVLAVVSPFVLPIGPVPVSLCTLAVYLIVYVLGGRRGTTAVLVYLLLGAAGMPVFSGFEGGLGKVLGPTGGYILGYLALAFLTGLAVDRFPGRRTVHLAGMVLATAVLYAFGTAWFCVQSGTPLEGALGLCVLPFLPGDGLKMAVVLAMGPVLRDRLRQAGVQTMG